MYIYIYIHTFIHTHRVGTKLEVSDAPDWYLQQHHSNVTANPLNRLLPASTSQPSAAIKPLNRHAWPVARGASHHPEVGQSLPGTCDKQVSIHTHMYPYCNNNNDGNMLIIIIINILLKVGTLVVAVEIKYRKSPHGHACNRGSGTRGRDMGGAGRRHSF